MESNGITRCEMLKDVGLVGIGALLGSGLTTLAGARRERGIAQGAGSERLWYELTNIGEPIMDYQLLWYLSHTGQAWRTSASASTPPAVSSRRTRTASE
jgi:hypothetical protein